MQVFLNDGDRGRGFYFPHPRYYSLVRLMLPNSNLDRTSTSEEPFVSLPILLKSL